jgi:hypothetical protein
MRRKVFAEEQKIIRRLTASVKPRYKVGDGDYDARDFLSRSDHVPLQPFSEKSTLAHQWCRDRRNRLYSDVPFRIPQERSDA